MLTTEAGFAPDTCPGFCGRVPLINGTEGWSYCGACPWGSRSNGAQCIDCDTPISLYDWLYLLFMALLPLMTHCFAVHSFSARNTSRGHLAAEYICCLLECLLSGVVSILLIPPRWSFQLFGCTKSSVKEWYPAFVNPVLHHVKKMRCSYEVVFPLYTLPFVFFLVLLVSVLLFRSLLYIFVIKRRRDGKPFYSALSSLPKIVIVHAALAGFIYNLYPYITILWCLGSNAIFLSKEGKTPFRVLLKTIFFSPRYIILLTLNMALFSYALIAILSPRGTPFSAFAFLLVPIPPVFYLLTVGLSHPSKVHQTF